MRKEGMAEIRFVMEDDGNLTIGKLNDFIRKHGALKDTKVLLREGYLVVCIYRPYNDIISFLNKN